MQRIWLALLIVPLAGCLADDAPTDVPTAVPDPFPDEPRVVVAVIDSGTTPYHEHFRRDSLPHGFLTGLEAQGVEVGRFDLAANGTFEERFERDLEAWMDLGQGHLYHFNGTSLLGISFGSDVPVIDDGGSSHGTATTGTVLDANPDAIVLLVEGDSNAGEAWAAQQPWIDIVSMSYGPPGSIPYSGGLVFDLDTSVNTRTMWDHGQVPVGAADNSPALAPNDETAGPPWVLGVAGDHPDSACREHVSGNFPDFTADFTQTLPTAYTVDEYHETSGTSFSTPMTAGVISRVLLEVRTAWNHTGGMVDGVLAVGPDGQTLTNADIRAALERTAYYFPVDACQPDPTDPFDATGAPVNPAAPWVQMGWGHVGPEIVNATVAHLLGLEEAPEKDAAAVAYQGALMMYREQLWGLPL